MAPAFLFRSQRPQGFLRNGFQQARPHHNRRNARGGQQSGGERAIPRSGDGVLRLPQGEVFAVGKRTRDLGVSDKNLRFGWHSRYGLALNLAPVNRVGKGGAVRSGARNTQAQEHAGHGLTGFGRTAAPVVCMAGGTGARVEQRSQPVAPGRGARGHDPVVIEKGVADEKCGAVLFILHVARRKTERLGRCVKYRGAAAGKFLARFGAGDVLGRGGPSDQGRGQPGNRQKADPASREWV